MQKVGKFEKVSYDQFYAAMKDGFDMEDEIIRDLYDGIELPTRATSGAAGYDFKSPMGFVLSPGKTIKVPTGIRVKIDSGWWLAALPRSGVGFKYRIQLDNTVSRFGSSTQCRWKMQLPISELVSTSCEESSARMPTQTSSYGMGTGLR